VAGYALLEGRSLLVALALAAPVAALAAAASAWFLTRSERAALASVGLMTVAATATYISGGRTEAHFLFFALLPLAALYASPGPFVTAIGFVAVHHFVLGSLVPGAVFQSCPNVLGMASLHAGAVLVESWACYIAWSRFEDRREHVERLVEERTAQLRAQRDELARLAAVVQSTDDAVFTAGADGLIETWNPGAERLYGWAAEEVTGRHVRLLFPDDARHVVEPALASLATTPNLHLERVHQRRDGSRFHALVTLSAIRAEDGALVGHAGIARDVTGQKRAAAEAVATARQLERQAGELTRLAHSDPLTGLANRAVMAERLEHVLATRRDRSAAVLLLDLDDFKTVNDVFGHGAGDEVLTEVGRRLTRCTRPDDTVARLGGDEFVVLLHNATGRDEALAVAGRLLDSVSAPIVWGRETFEVGCSVGVTLIDPAGDRDAAAVLRDADIAMYVAKAAGRNTARVFEPSMREEIVAHSQLVRDLRAAVPDGQLRLLYQPQVDLLTGRITGVEALVRWQHPERGFLTPDAFIPAAETTGLIDLVDDWVLAEAFRQLAAWDARGPADLHVAVNISARRLARSDLADTLARHAGSTGVDAARLELEITETAAFNSSTDPAAVLREVRALGTSVAIDDFGMGHSSFGRLHALPVDRMKIDRSFVATLDPATASGSIAAAMVALGSSLALDVVAEGVETGEQLRALQALGCPTGQGYLFGRPLRPEQLAELVARQAVAGVLAR
jgi:diguanylate cyclase (GGDEF)-like protein/PAS domain S-box-containing protein